MRAKQSRIFFKTPPRCHLFKFHDRSHVILFNRVCFAREFVIKKALGQVETLKLEVRIEIGRMINSRDMTPLICLGLLCWESAESDRYFKLI